MAFSTKDPFKAWKRRRTQAQKLHTHSLNPSNGHGDITSNKENVDPRVQQLKNKVRSLKHTSKCTERKLKASSHREMRTRKQLLEAKQSNTTLVQEHGTALAEVQQAHVKSFSLLEEKESVIASLNDKLLKSTAALEKITTKQQERAVQKAIMDNPKNTHLLKEHGVVPDDMRALIRNMVADGVTTEHIFPIIKQVTATFGINVTGSISARTISQIIIEGSVADDLNIVDKIKNAQGITYSGDGTTIQSIAHESRTINVMQDEGTHTHLYLGVHSAVNHTAETQLAGLQLQIKDIYETHNSSLKAGESKMDSQTFAMKLTGAVTDHAADQKKLVRLLKEWKKSSNREFRGEQKIISKSPDEMIRIVLLTSKRTVDKAGGCAKWEALSEQAKIQLEQETYKEICAELGETVFQQLPEFEREIASFFAWTGCCMHKELNTVKGGNSEMVKHWEANSLEGPIQLPNRDTAAALAEGAKPAKSVQGGAIKVMSLAGALFNNKDDKKGEQDSIKCAFEEMFRFPNNFPDTSNTRYQSHCEAAAELIVHLPFYRKYFELMKDRKESRLLNHMEKNVQMALDDIPTLQELCVLALFLQIISRPYMRVVRGEGHQDHNILDMGPLHGKVAAHMKKIISNPMLILSPAATFETASMDNLPWDRAEVLYSVWRLAPTMPNLKGLVVAFFTGALETWERFTAEFLPGGLIACTSPRLRALAWMPTTNDVNEGALGLRHVIKRSFPKASKLMLNAQQQYRWNKTGNFIRSLDPEKLQFLRKHAHYLQSFNIQKKLRIARAKYDQAIVKQKQDQDAIKLEKRRIEAEMLAKITPILCLVTLAKSKLTNADLDKQLPWHRQFNPKVGKKTELRTKPLKTGALQVAITVLNERIDKNDIIAQYGSKMAKE
ncbi:hypothetical protein M422DRAFT_259003 [Sphaerobolus stellatus SS14]|uniref:Uncharacterized protein n=1 Tax=Sphaerobolus stellatus (strain SS14) TaxID=990650 RepID=A0A0C9VLC6_SPHS4|nr:hypothetical protein M422DRAFT_259003 [Sphaerobolus stellatus SS14]